ncbi:MAG: biliverdin-producing heme oxygenase [Anaerolineales bacterium]|nr:biliverdin-producing heme oxygenase [Anaerolineales bacterium]
MSLSAALREGTKHAHRAAENTPFIRAFLAAQVSPETYGQLLARLYQVYSVLEASLEKHRAHPLVSTIHSEALSRIAALECDLLHFLGADWPSRIHPTPATQTYTARIQQLAQEWPLGLIAHHYTRYLGDLSGGQALKRVATKAFNLQNGQGVAFYEFPQIPDPQQFKAEYRNQLDQLAIDAATIEQLTQEANRAFELNTHLFAELSAN